MRGVGTVARLEKNLITPPGDQILRRRELLLDENAPSAILPFTRRRTVQEKPSGVPVKPTTASGASGAGEAGNFSPGKYSRQRVWK